MCVCVCVYVNVCVCVCVRAHAHVRALVQICFHCVVALCFMMGSGMEK